MNIKVKFTENNHSFKATMSETSVIDPSDNLAKVAKTGDYNDLINTPSKVSEFENDSGYIKAENEKKVEVKTNSALGFLFEAISQIRNLVSSIRITPAGIAIEGNSIVIGGDDDSYVHIRHLATPENDGDATPKGYVDNTVGNKADKSYVDGLVGNIETALDGIIALQNSLIGGES